MRPNCLAPIDKELPVRLEHVSDEQLRAAALAASQFGLAHVSLTSPAIDAGLEALEQKQYGNGKVRTQVESVVSSFDDKQWTLQDEGKGEDPAYNDAFEKARTANAVYYALDEDGFKGATRAFYEANAASRNLPGLKTTILAALEAAH